MREAYPNVVDYHEVSWSKIDMVLLQTGIAGTVGSSKRAVNAEDAKARATLDGAGSLGEPLPEQRAPVRCSSALPLA